MLKIVKQRLSTTPTESPKQLFKYLMRQCEKLPKGPKEHYKFQIKQSFKQHVEETDLVRIQEIMKRSHEDAAWILKKYAPDKN
ncbi:hypothetical protein HHI36_006856 [Cryptolaemus montrouzieri]|uniref:LYR motif-containing protein 9 n=1 Tax=Cryptolaemus montrouzieri TaxID=559131 RepID=A0ABD2MMU8_9CUCU